MTYRIVILGRPDEELSHNECIEYLEHEHIPLVKQLPGLYRLTTPIPLDPDEMGYDEMAQLWFKAATDLDTAMGSDTVGYTRVKIFDAPGRRNPSRSYSQQYEEWQRILADAENFVNVEETVVVTVADKTMRYQAVPETV